MGSSAVVYPGLNDPASLEAIACNEGISLTLDLHLSKVVVVSDCLEVINNLKRNETCRYVMILKEIDYRSSLVQDVSFIHEKRETNFEAHALVKAAVTLPIGRSYLYSSGSG